MTASNPNADNPVYLQERSDVARGEERYNLYKVWLIQYAGDPLGLAAQIADYDTSTALLIESLSSLAATTNFPDIEGQASAWAQVLTAIWQPA